MTTLSGSQASPAGRHWPAAVMMLTSSLLVLAVGAEAKFNGVDETNLGTKLLLKKEVPYGQSFVAKAKISSPLVEGKLKFTFLNSTSGFGDLRLQAATGGAAAAVSSATCSGDDCSWKYVPAAGLDSDEYGQVQVKKDSCQGSGDYTCCLTWKTIENDNEGPSTPAGKGIIGVAKCENCGEFCDWCREMNPHNHPGLDMDRSFVRLSPSHIAGASAYCSDACVAASRDATPQLFLRNAQRGDTSGFWDCRMEFVAT